MYDMASRISSCTANSENFIIDVAFFVISGQKTILFFGFQSKRKLLILRYLK